MVWPGQDRLQHLYTPGGTDSTAAGIGHGGSPPFTPVALAPFASAAGLLTDETRR